VFTLNAVVPWGRSFDEYCRMFALGDAELAGRIVGCADGPASFNVEATERGSRVVSCDPLYRFDAADVRRRIAETYEDMLEQVRRNQDAFVWTSIHSVEELGRVRMAAMTRFLDDYEAGRASGRYVDAALPGLPFADALFDLAVCSHFLFLYTTQLGEALHRQAVHEMLRVAKEVRIFPLLALDGKQSPYVDLLTRELHADGRRVAIERVPYEFQRGGNQMMRIT
jgi:hypothetical protein